LDKILDHPDFPTVWYKNQPVEDAMDLYFAPLACSMATRITLYEAGASANFRQVDTKAKRVDDGTDFLSVNPMGQVPVLRTDFGETLTENPVVLQYVADQYPESGLAPESGMPRYRLQQWLGFITSELHKLVFSPLLDPRSAADAKGYATGKVAQRFAYLNTHLESREYLLDQFTVADAYLIVVLNWARFAGLDLAQWLAVQSYFQRMSTRPSVARAFAEEFALYQEERARHAA
jgi:glutathione S-transferase